MHSFVFNYLSNTQATSSTDPRDTTQYKFIKPIGEGTFGIVDKCLHKATKQIVAIKKLKY